jgi:non-specific serine/threonine protein kinase/serine/threonine-protein kinase
MANLAATLESGGNYAEAEKLGRETLEARRRVLGPEHPDTLLSMMNLSNTLQSESKYAEAEKLQRETLDIQRRVLGPEHPDTLSSMNNLAYLLQEEGRYAEAEKSYRETLGIVPRVLGPNHPLALMLMQNLGITLSHEKRYAEAKNLFREVIEKASRTREEGVLPQAWYSFACGEAAAGHPDEALKYLRKAVDLQSGPVTDLESDNELKSLRNDPRFIALVAYARQHGTPAKQPKN